MEIIGYIREKGSLVGRMWTGLSLAKALIQKKGLTIEQTLKIIDLPQEVILLALDDEDLDIIAEELAKKLIEENNGEIPKGIGDTWLDKALVYFMPLKNTVESDELIPLAHRQEINSDNYYKFVPYECKIEVFDGDLFGSEEERKRFLLMLLSNIGLENFIKMLPVKSKDILIELLKSI